MKKFLHLLTAIFFASFAFSANAQSSQLVLAVRGVGAHQHEIDIRTSSNGTDWSPLTAVSINGTLAQTAVTPNISSDGVRYQLVWMEPNGNVRFAVGTDLAHWLVQESPLGTLAPGAQPKFSQGNGIFLALLNNQVRILGSPGNQGATVTAQGSYFSIAFGQGQFIVAAVSPFVIGQGNSVSVFQSTDGLAWNSIGTAATAEDGWVISAADISFAEGRFLLAVGSEKRTGDLTNQRCPVFGSTDGRVWVQDSPSNTIPPTCAGGTDQWLLATRFQSHTLVLRNLSNTELIFPWTLVRGRRCPGSSITTKLA